MLELHQWYTLGRYPVMTLEPPSHWGKFSSRMSHQGNKTRSQHKPLFWSLAAMITSELEPLRQGSPCPRTRVLSLLHTKSEGQQVCWWVTKMKVICPEAIIKMIISHVYVNVLLNNMLFQEWLPLYWLASMWLIHETLCLYNVVILSRSLVAYHCDDT